MQFLQVDTKAILELWKQWLEVSRRILAASDFPSTQKIMYEESYPLLQKLNEMVAKEFFGYDPKNITVDVCKHLGNGTKCCCNPPAR